MDLEVQQFVIAQLLLTGVPCTSAEPNSRVYQNAWEVMPGKPQEQTTIIWHYDLDLEAYLYINSQPSRWHSEEERSLQIQKSYQSPRSSYFFAIQVTIWIEGLSDNGAEDERIRVQGAS